MKPIQEIVSPMRGKKMRVIAIIGVVMIYFVGLSFIPIYGYDDNSEPDPSSTHPFQYQEVNFNHSFLGYFLIIAAFMGFSFTFLFITRSIKEFHEE